MYVTMLQNNVLPNELSLTEISLSLALSRMTVTIQQDRAKVILFAALQDVTLPAKLAQTHGILTALLDELRQFVAQTGVAASVVPERSLTMKLDLVHLLLGQYSPSLASVLNAGESSVYMTTLLDFLQFSFPTVLSSATQQGMLIVRTLRSDGSTHTGSVMSCGRLVALFTGAALDAAPTERPLPHHGTAV